MVRTVFFLLLVAVPRQEADIGEKRKYVEKNVAKGIAAGLRALREAQQPGGSFNSQRQRGQHGVTGLALYTFLALGTPLKDPAPGKALDWLLANPFSDDNLDGADTYQISLVAVGLSYAIPHLEKGPRKERAVSMLQRAADWLVAAQQPGGGWSYNNQNRRGHDHSNSQFAVLGLRAAANAGARVKKEVWEREVTHYKTSQLEDGGWGYLACYQKPGRAATSTMTAAGVMGLTLALGSTGKKDQEVDRAIARGLKAMEAFWRMGITKGLKSLGGVPYLLYSVERACMLTGQEKLGDIDWYVEGAWVLLREQKEDGLLGTGPMNGPDRNASNCFSLLFLNRAFNPVATPSNSKPDSPTPPGEDGEPREME